MASWRPARRRPRILRGSSRCAVLRVRIPSPRHAPGRSSAGRRRRRQRTAARARAARRGRDRLSAGRHSRSPHQRPRPLQWLQLLDFDRTIDEMPDLEAAKRVRCSRSAGRMEVRTSGSSCSTRSVSESWGGSLPSTGRGRSLPGSRRERRESGRPHRLLRRIDAHPLAGRVAEPVARSPSSDPRRSTPASSERSSGRRATAVLPWLRVARLLDRGGGGPAAGQYPCSGLYVLGLAYQHWRAPTIGGVGRTPLARTSLRTRHSHGVAGLCQNLLAPFPSGRTAIVNAP